MVPNSSEQAAVVAFLHVATLGRYQEILDEMLGALTKANCFDQIRVYVVGHGPVAEYSSARNISVTRTGLEVEAFEFPTLQAMREFAVTSPSARILYVNCLGGRYVGRGWNIRAEWRRLIRYLLIEKAIRCLEELKHFDICGIDWSETPMPHFTSNNWWATARHVALLPDVYSFANLVETHVFPLYDDRWKLSEVRRRHAAEFWVGSRETATHASLLPLSKLGFPLGEYGSVSWWDMPNIKWESIARRQYDGVGSYIDTLKYGCDLVYFNVRSIKSKIGRTFRKLHG